MADQQKKPGTVGTISPEFQAEMTRLTSNVGAALGQIKDQASQIKAGMTEDEAASVRNQISSLSGSIEEVMNNLNPTPAPPPPPPVGGRGGPQGGAQAFGS